MTTIQTKPSSSLIQPRTTFQTERLLLRPFLFDDFSELHRVYGNAQVMRYIGEGARTPAETRTELNKFIAHWQEHGFGPMAVVHKASGEVIGRSGYYRSPRSLYPQMGYIISADYQGQKLGTELALGCLQLGFGQFNFLQVDAFTMPENEISQYILSHKLSMRREPDIYYCDRLYVRFTLTQAEYCQPPKQFKIQNSKFKIGKVADNKYLRVSAYAIEMHDSLPVFLP